MMIGWNPMISGPLADFLRERFTEEGWADPPSGPDARVLADRQAKIRIVGRYARQGRAVEAGTIGASPEQMFSAFGELGALDYVVRALAFAYADHPAYREEWKADDDPPETIW